MSSWVDSGLDAARNTWAPPARSAPTSTAVSAVTCRQAATAQPGQRLLGGEPGRDAGRSTGMDRSAQPIRASPALASPASVMSPGRPAARLPGHRSPQHQHPSQ